LTDLTASEYSVLMVCDEGLMQTKTGYSQSVSHNTYSATSDATIGAVPVKSWSSLRAIFTSRVSCVSRREL